MTHVPKYFMNTPSPKVLVDGEGFESSSSRGKYMCRIGMRSAPSIVQASAFIPWVFENMSIVKPSTNDNVRTQFTLIVTGSLMMKYMNTNGIATLNRHRLLNTITCAATRATNQSKYFKISFAMLCSLLETVCGVLLRGLFAFNLLDFADITIRYHLHCREGVEVREQFYTQGEKVVIFTTG